MVENIDKILVSTTRYSHFNLYAVSNHYGTMGRGHYTAYCKSDITRGWHKYDDQVRTMIGREIVGGDDRDY